MRRSAAPEAGATEGTPAGVLDGSCAFGCAEFASGAPGAPNSEDRNKRTNKLALTNNDPEGIPGHGKYFCPVIRSLC